MTEKPTCEGLQQRVKELEREVSEHKQTEESLRESENRYRIIFEQAADSIVIIDPITGMLVNFNDKGYENLGYTHQEFQKIKLSEIEVHESEAEVIKHLAKVLKEGSDTFETQQRTKDGQIRDISVCSRAISIQGKDFVQGIWRDITDRNKDKEALKKAKDELEHRVQERTRELELKTKSLEELNTAMKVLLEKRKEDKTEVEENVMNNVKGLISPYFDKINETKLDDHQKAILDILQSNLDEIVSPFTRKLSMKYLCLTPKEIMIVNMIKIGYPSKKIAKMMGISSRTVDTHRKNIRSKIGLGQKRANLRAHLLAHEQ